MAYCNEVARTIEIIQKNIAHIEKDLKNPNYTEQQKEELRKDLEYQRERLEEARQQQQDCIPGP